MAIFRRLSLHAKKYFQDVMDINVSPTCTLFKFNSDADLARFESYDDREFGGCSTAELRLGSNGTTAVFEGELSSELNPEAKNFLRKMRTSGFAGFRTVPLEDENEFLEQFEPYNSLRLRHRGDGRVYFASLSTRPWVAHPTCPPDVYQATLVTHKDKWVEQHLTLDDFVLTWKGRIVPVRKAIANNRILSFSISLATGHGVQEPGPFKFELESVVGHRH